MYYHSKAQNLFPDSCFSFFFFIISFYHIYNCYPLFSDIYALLPSIFISIQHVPSSLSTQFTRPLLYLLYLRNLHNLCYSPSDKKDDDGKWLNRIFTPKDSTQNDANNFGVHKEFDKNTAFVRLQDFNRPSDGNAAKSQTIKAGRRIR